MASFCWVLKPTANRSARVLGLSLGAQVNVMRAPPFPKIYVVPAIKRKKNQRLNSCHIFLFSDRFFQGQQFWLYISYFQLLSTNPCMKMKLCFLLSPSLNKATSVHDSALHFLCNWKYILKKQTKSFHQTGKDKLIRDASSHLILC